MRRDAEALRQPDYLLMEHALSPPGVDLAPERANLIGDIRRALEARACCVAVNREEKTMRVRPAADRDLEMIAGWLAEPRISKWLDFGTDRPLTALALKYAISQGSMRLFTYAPADGEQDAPIGVVGLSSIHPRFRTALLWYALGEPRFAGRSLTGSAAAEVVRIGFHELDLRAIHAWVVVGNEASVKILENIGFRRIGRQRQCHHIEGRRRDRLLFDIVSNEFAAGISALQRRSAILAFAHDASFSFGGVDGSILSSIPWG
jgi:RimJ/RimL family protein N-acetyltransferase